jgi:hypothetical protein
VYQNKSANFSGRRMHLLMLALPFALRDLTFPEIEDITSQIAKPWHRLHDRVVVPPVDPSRKILEALYTFMEWYLTVRMPEIGVSKLLSLFDSGDELVETLKRVFPDRDGKETGWKIGKCHDIVHVAQNIALFGWSENTSGEWGEHSHIDLLKCLAKLTNNKDIFSQLASWHDRAGQLQQELQAESNHTGSEGNADDSQQQSWCRTKGNSPCELAVTYPLLHAAMHFKDLKYSIGSNKKGKGRYILDVRALPADRVPQLDLVKEHPMLNHLPTALGVFAFDFLQNKLGLNQQQEPTVAQANEVLTNNMIDTKLRTFACLTLKLPGCQGVQRIRSFPFGPNDLFHGRNRRPTVFVIPPKRFSKTSYSSFKLEGPADVKKLWIGRVELLFTCSFNNQDQRIPCDLALISFLYPFDLPDAIGPLQRLAGCQMYYDPAPRHWLRLVPVSYIIGR